MDASFDPVFARLRAILEAYAPRFSVTVDEPGYYCLSVDFSPKLKKGFPVAWVKTVKGYVGYHFMPVYMMPGLKDTMSGKLEARMQGKSCFNFKTVDDALFSELEKLTSDGFAACRKAGFV
jgi:hypothetical protein